MKTKKTQTSWLLPEQFPNGNRIALYTRVASLEIRDPDGALACQERGLRELLESLNSGKNFGTVTHTFSDAGISGMNRNRPGLMRLLGVVKRDEVDVILVTDLSKISRNTSDFAEILAIAQSHGCVILSLADGLVQTSARVVEYSLPMQGGVQ